MATEGQVTKIYDLRTIGYDDVFQKLNAINNMFATIKKTKQDLSNVRDASSNTAEISELNKRIAEQDRLMVSLKNRVDELTTSERRYREEVAKTTAGPDTAATKVSQYAQLIAKYKEATAAARELALQYGAESQQAQAAARVAAGYKTELTAINNLIKNGSAQTALLTQEQARNTERTKQLNQETRQLARDQIAAANSVEKLRAQLALATARRNTLVIDSEDFKLAEKDVAELNKRLSEIEQRSGDFRRNVGNYKSGFDGVRNSINQLTREAPAFANSIQTGFLALSNNIPIFFDEIGKARAEITRLRAEGQQVPGLFQRIAASVFSFGTLLSIGVTLLTVYGKEIGEFIKSLFRGRDAMDQFTVRQRLLNEEVKSGSGTYTEAIRQFKELQINVELAKNGLISKKDVVDQYNETIGKTVGQVKTLDEVEQALVKNGDAYIRMMLLKAAANLALEDAAKKAVEAEKIRLQRSDEFLNAGDRFIAFGAGNSSAPGFVPGQGANERVAGQFKQQRGEDRKAAAKQAADDDIKTLEDIAKQFQADAAKIADQFGFKSFLGNDDPDKTGGASKLDTATQEELKRIDASRNLLLAAERTRVNEIARLRKLSFDEEVQYQRNLEEINATALQSSIRLLERKKSLNAEEQQTLAQYREDLSALYLDTSNKINEIEKRRYEQEERLINQRLQLRANALEREKDLINQDPTISAQDKAQAQLEIDQAILDAQLVALAQLEQQRDQFNQEAIVRQREAIERTRQVVQQDQRKVTLAQLEDIRADGERKKSQITASYAVQRKTILDNEKLTAEQKKRQLQLLDQAERRTILSAELETLNKEVATKKLLLDQSLISNDEYLKAVEAQAQKAAELSAASGTNVSPQRQAATNLQGLLQNSIGKRIGADPGSSEDQLLANVIANSFDVAKQAMEGYFQAEEQNIRNSLRIAQERLKIEEEQALNRAQSQQDQERLRREFDAKKRAEEKKAGEELKKIKIAEARIALASELANIAAAAASNPANGATFGAAGAIMYGVLAATAIARYGLNVANIQRTQFFEKGGNLQSSDVPVRGGDIGGKPHGQGGAPFSFNGQSYEAEVAEMNIIRTKDAPKNKTYTISGTQRQIASMLNQIGGGVAFAPGASVRKFALGGSLGENLQPPSFSTVNNLFASQQISRADLDQILEKYTGTIEQLTAEQASRLDRIEVIQVTSSVTNAQKKEALQSNIAVL